MDEIERKDLISRIEHGEYVTYEMPKYAVSKDVVFLIVLGIIYPAMLAVEAMMRHINLDAEVMLNVERVRSIYPIAALILFILVVTIRLAAHIKKKKAIYNLGDVTAEEKRLILQGEIINARFKSVTDSEKGSVLVCEANYNEQNLCFRSPAIRAQFLPMSGEPIQVFVDKNDPKKYLVNIYNHIPRKGPKVLSDGTLLKCEAPDEEEHWAKIVMSILGTVFLILFWPLILVFIIMLMMPLVSMVVGIRDGKIWEIAGGAVVTALEVLAAMTIYKRGRRIGVFRRGTKFMRPTNYYLEVTANKHWITEYKVKGEKGKVTHRVHHISARYIQPETNYVYDFCATGPEIISRVVGKEVRVYVDPKNMNKYYIDFPSALRNMGMNYTDNGFTFDNNGIWYEK